MELKVRYLVFIKNLNINLERKKRNKMKKKNLIGCLVALATIATLSGCGGRATTGKINFTIPEGGYDGSAVTVTFYHTMGSTNLQPVLDKYIEKFNESFPNITIKHEQIGGYDEVRDKIKEEISIGQQPSMAYCYPDHVALYNKAKGVVTLDQFIDDTKTYTAVNAAGEEFEYTFGLTQAEKDNFIEGYYQAGAAYGDGLMYSMPFSKSTEVLYYNKTFFTENNLTVPTTWDEMWEVCAKIKEIAPNSIPLGYDSPNNWFITMTEQMGSGYTSATGDHFLFDNKENRDWLSDLKTQYDKGYFTTQGLLGAYTSSIFTEVGEGADVIKSYMSIGSSAGATHQRPAKDANGNYPFDVGITSIPQLDANNPKVISQGPDLTLFKSENPQEVCAAWLFTKFLTTSVEFQAEFGLASGYVPVIKSVSENSIYKNAIANADGGDNIAALSAKVCLEQSDAYYTSPAFVGSSTARDQVGALLEAVVTGSKTLDKAFQDAIDECEYSI